MKNILIPIDLSNTSVSAIDFGYTLLKKAKSQLTFLHTYQLFNPLIDGTYSVSPSVADRENELIKDMRDFVEKIIPPQDLSTCTFITDIGIPEDSILYQIKQTAPDLVIMGTEGASGLKKLVGSNTANVMLHSKVPILSIPNPNPLPNSQLKIALASDYHQLENYKVLDSIKALGEIFNTEIHILNIENEKNKSLEAKEIKAAIEQEFHPLSISFHTIINPEVLTGLMIYCQSHKIDILGIVHRKHSFLEKLFNSSIAKTAIQESKQCILTLHESS
ncbi:universal stress protein [Rapidithrix thailandica]|uniref:Universal stress protein n=1 Tax=Rapidithrix thailandica TaxID=413964 RepID=A0AAW9SE86_9BACT